MLIHSHICHVPAQSERVEKGVNGIEGPGEIIEHASHSSASFIQVDVPSADRG